MLLIATLAILTVAAHAADEFVADELLVAFQPGTRGAQADGILNGLRATRIKAWPEVGAEHWHLPPGLGVPQAIQALSANPNVLYAEPNYTLHATDVPNDPRLPEMWGLHNIAQSGGTADADIDAVEAWSVRTDANSVVVGVSDSGIDYYHPDLAANIWLNSGEMGTDVQGRDKATNGIDDDGNGYPDDWHGWNFVNNTNDPFDDYYHGTHVAGIIGAVGNNDIGVAGVAWSVKLMPLKHLNSSGIGAISTATDAILYAAKFVDPLGRKIVQITSHSYVSASKSKTLENAIKTCGALVVAAAGNNGSNTMLYPAAYAQPNVISVAATDATDALASFSNFGSWVQLAAPGVSILSTTPNNGYAFKDGTSMATPHVSGVAALVLAQNPVFSIADLKAQILNNVDVLPGLSGKVTTSGRLNVRKALGAPELLPDTTAPAFVTDLAAAPASATSVTLTWTAPGDDGNVGTAFFYDIRYSRTPINTDADFSSASRVGGEPAPQAASAAETLTLENLSDNTTWYFALKTVDEFGNSSLLSNLASVTTPLGDWRYLRLDWGQNVGNYVSLGITTQGGWSVAYDDAVAGVLKCAFHPAGVGYYYIETVGSGGVGASLAYSPSEAEVSISHVYGNKLYFANRSAGVWISTQLESKDVYAGDTSLAYDSSGSPCISYCKTGRNLGLWYARRSGSSWTTQQVQKNARAYHNQMAIDPAGRPIIVFSDDTNGDGSLDALKLARFDGAAWSISLVDTVASTFVTVACDLVTGNPAVACKSGADQLRFFRWTGAAWSAPEIVDTAAPITGCSLAFAPDGRAFLAYGVTEMRLAIRDPNSGAWTVQVMDGSTMGSLRNSVKGRSLMTPGNVAYQGPADPGYQVGPDPAGSTTVRLAFRQTPY
jgi:subtilisin family serine protease